MDDELTVGELIRELEKMPWDTEIRLNDGNGGLYTLGRVAIPKGKKPAILWIERVGVREG